MAVRARDRGGNVLERWLAEAVEAAGVEVDGSLLTGASVTRLLDLARDAAHAVERPAAPLAAFAAGLALGRSGGGADELDEVAGRIAARAGAWAPDGG